MMRLTCLLALLFVNLDIFCQVVPNDSIGYYIGKEITVFGQVKQASFNHAKKNDTTVLYLADSATSSALKLVIYPPARVGFGFRPEEVLLNKEIYASGTAMFTNGSYKIVISSPFDIAFSKEKLFRNKANIGFAEADASLPLDFERLPPPPQQVNKKQAVAKEKKVENATANVTKPEKVVQKATTAQPRTNTPKSKPETSKPSVKNDVPSIKNNSPVANGNPNPLTAAGVKVADTLVGKQLVLQSRVRLRSGPGNYFISIGTIEKGEKVRVLSFSTPWCKIARLQPINGKISEGYVQLKALVNK